MSPVIYACCAQALIMLVTLSLRESLPPFFSDWSFYIIVNVIPLAVGTFIASGMKTWKERFVALGFALGSSLAVLMIFGFLGVAMSLFVFNK